MLQVESTKNSFLALSNYLNKVEVILCQDLNLLLLFFGSNFSPLTHLLTCPPTPPSSLKPSPFPPPPPTP